MEQVLTLSGKEPNLTFYLPTKDQSYGLPFIGKVSCGFPNQADEYLHLILDLNQKVVTDRDATVFAEVDGNSMVNAGFNNGDILIIDRGKEYKHGKIYLAIIDGDLVCKRLHIKEEKNGKRTIWLKAENEDYAPIRITPENEFIIFGAVTWVLKDMWK